MERRFVILVVVVSLGLVEALKEKRSYFEHHSPHWSSEHITVDKYVPVPVPQPYHVSVEKHVPYPVEVVKENYKPYPVTVTKDVYKPYPVVKEIPQPYPVTVPKLVPRPYPVEVTKAYPVKVPVHVNVQRYVPVSVPKPYHVPVHINTQSNSESHEHTFSSHHVGGYVPSVHGGIANHPGYNSHSNEWKW